MFALISRILNLSGRYKSRIQAAFLCAFVESILSKMPIFMAFIVLAGFADNTLTGKVCLFVGLGLLAGCSGSDSGSLFERPSAKCRWIYDLC